MKHRLVVAATLAVATVASSLFMSSARADEPTIDTDVGGGVAPLIGVLGVGSPILYDFGLPETTELTSADPQAVLPADGGTFTASAVDQAVGPVHARALYGTITGRRDGKPFAEATTSLADVSVGGLKLGTVTTHCRWDTNRVFATTSIQTGPITAKPAPNTKTVIPGLGTIIRNEQYVNRVYARDSNGNLIWVGPGQYDYLVYLTKVVIGVDVYLNADLQALYGYANVMIGYASCDPLQIPSISGLKQFSPST